MQTISQSVIVDQMVKRVKRGEHTTETATEYLRNTDIFVGRGTHRRLLQAEAYAILNADHAHIAG